jgi:hypothetical protein
MATRAGSNRIWVCLSAAFRETRFRAMATGEHCPTSRDHGTSPPTAMNRTGLRAVDIDGLAFGCGSQAAFIRSRPAEGGDS